MVARRFVVAVDFSDCSRRALEAATELAKDLGASLTLVHAFSRPMRIPLNAEGSVDPLAEVQREINLDEAVELTAEWASIPRKAGVETEVVAKEASTRDLVLQTAADLDASLIVVGRHGWGAVKRFILGSIAGDLVTHSDRPVLVVPEPSD